MVGGNRVRAMKDAAVRTEVSMFTSSPLSASLPGPSCLRPHHLRLATAPLDFHVYVLTTVRLAIAPLKVAVFAIGDNTLNRLTILRANEYAVDKF